MGGTDLLDRSFFHDHNGVGHGKGFFLVMGDIDESDAQPLLHILEFDLHLLTQLQIKRAQRLVKEQNLRFINQGPGDGHPLLLAPA